MDALPVFISSCALVLSILAFIIGNRARRESARQGRMPVLVFEYDGRRGWLLRNVGNGPALNIVVARKHMQRPIDGEWFDLVRIPPLSRDGEMLLDWLQHDNEHGLGAAYDDFTQRTSGGSSYTTTCGDDLSEITVGRLFGTGGSEIRPHWRS